jgi:hypothetical protein
MAEHSFTELNFGFDSLILDEETEHFLEDVVHDIVDEVEDVPEQKQPKRKKTPRNYINNADFCNALIEYKQQCDLAVLAGNPKPRMPNYIGECFIKLAEGLARRPNFFGYSYKDEMIADGIENCLTYFENFNPEKTLNPFAYFTRILWWCFVRRIQKEKKQQYIKYKATENFGILDEAELMELGDGQIKQIEVYDNMYEFIKKFEDNELKKSNKTVTPKKTSPAGVEKFLEE